MNILYCGDKHMEQGLILSVLSLTKHIKEPLNIFILTMSFPRGEKPVEPLPPTVTEKLDAILAPMGGKSTIFDISRQFSENIPTANLSTRFTPCCMLRLFADMLELPDRLLYLDTDVLCRKDISQMYHRDMEGVEVAGVLDHYGRFFFRRSLFSMDYLNSGVLLMNMTQIRRTGLLAKCRQLCREKKMFMPDQSAINKLAVSKAKLPRRYNDQRRLHGDTVLQHFTTHFRFFPYIRTVTVKPWQIDKMHSVLKLHEYDDLLKEFQSILHEKPEVFL